MASVFIGGSRAISRLNPIIRERSDDLMHRGCVILIGDANGADRMVQQYFADQGYRDIVVYCMSRCRNNVGDWPIKKVESVSKTKGFAYYAAKDLAMAQDANCGVMLWDGASNGTLNIIQNLIGSDKKVLVYLSATKSFVKLNDQPDLESLLLQCDPREIAVAQSHRGRSGASCPRHPNCLSPPSVS
ncbi:MAG: hypothetical protein M1274_11995 [Actinobacteria bacterium]|nr:hypothetical protein [Actinomycetota bacterium]